MVPNHYPLLGEVLLHFGTDCKDPRTPREVREGLYQSLHDVLLLKLFPDPYYRRRRFLKNYLSILKFIDHIKRCVSVYTKGCSVG